MTLDELKIGMQFTYRNYVVKITEINRCTGIIQFKGRGMSGTTNVNEFDKILKSKISNKKIINLDYFLDNIKKL